MNRIKTIKCIGAAGVLFAGLFATSAVFAGGGNDDVASPEQDETQEWGYGGGYYGGGYYYDDDDDDYRRYRRYRRHRRYYYDDDDDDYRRRRRHRRYRHRRHRRHYYYNETNLGITDLTFFDLGSKLEAEVVLTGINGDEPVKVDIEAMADVSSACGVAQIANEQLDIQSDGSQTLEQADIQAGELLVTVESDDSATHAASLAECPGLEVQEVGYLDARIDVSQGDKVLTLLCTFKAPTVDGEIADENIECSAF